MLIIYFTHSCQTRTGPMQYWLGHLAGRHRTVRADYAGPVEISSRSSV